MHSQPPSTLFSLRHLIIVGASERRHSLGERLLTSLLRTPFNGQITPVNLRHKTVGGLKAYTNIGRVPESADAVVAVTPPDSYEAVLKACRKQNIPYAVLIQDWENLPEDILDKARTTAQKARKLNVQAIVCHPGGIHIPALGLNAGTGGDAPAGNIGLISDHPSESAEAIALLKQAGLGVSCHIGLHHPLSPTSSADIMALLSNDPNTHIIVSAYNRHEHPRTLFSIIRRTVRRKPVILSVTSYTDKEEKAVLKALSLRTGAIVVFSPEELAAALHTLSARKHTARKLHLIADKPCGRLHSKAESLGIALQIPPENQRPSENPYGYIGPNPTAMHYRSLADGILQHHQTEALLAVVSGTDPNARDTTRILSHLQKQSEKPLYIVSPFSDGLLGFNRTIQALTAFRFQADHAAFTAKLVQTAKPLPAYVKTPDAQQAARIGNQPAKLAAALFLPEPGSAESPVFATLRFRRHPHYGSVLYVDTHGQTTAYLPPFSTLDTERLIQQTDLKRHQKTLHQLLHSLNTVSDGLPNIDSITVTIGADGACTEIIPSETAGHTPNILAPYPARPAHTFTLKNGRSAHIRIMLPEDAEAKQTFVRNLSDHHRYTRYMTHLKELTPAMLAQACNLDYHYEAAVVAEAEDGTWLGVSRFSSTGIPERCEFGISIAEAAQGQGLAVHLMQQIIHLAKQQGYQEMYAEILKTNPAMHKLAEKLGFSAHPSPFDNTLTEVIFNLNPEPDTPVNNIKRNLKQQILALRS